MSKFSKQQSGGIFDCPFSPMPRRGAGKAIATSNQAPPYQRRPFNTLNSNGLDSRIGGFWKARSAPTMELLPPQRPRSMPGTRALVPMS